MFTLKFRTETRQAKVPASDDELLELVVEMAGNAVVYLYNTTAKRYVNTYRDISEGDEVLLVPVAKGGIVDADTLDEAVERVRHIAITLRADYDPRGGKVVLTLDPPDEVDGEEIVNRTYFFVDTDTFYIRVRVDEARTARLVSGGALTVSPEKADEVAEAIAREIQRVLAQAAEEAARRAETARRYPRQWTITAGDVHEDVIERQSADDDDENGEEEVAPPRQWGG